MSSVLVAIVLRSAAARFGAVVWPRSRLVAGPVYRAKLGEVKAVLFKRPTTHFLGVFIPTPCRKPSNRLGGCFCAFWVAVYEGVIGRGPGFAPD